MSFEPIPSFKWVLMLGPFFLLEQCINKSMNPNYTHEKTLLLDPDATVAVVSDAHIGLDQRYSRPHKLLELYHRLADTHTYLILNGDTFETWRYKGFGWSDGRLAKKVQYLLLDYPELDKLLKRANVFVIVGNHDYVLQDHETPFPTYGHIYLPQTDCMIVHGHDSDRTHSSKAIDSPMYRLFEFGSWALDKLYELLGINEATFNEQVRIAFSTEKSRQRIYTHVEQNLRYRRIIYGHTHVHEIRTLSNGTIYHNCGSSVSVDDGSTEAIVIDRDGFHKRIFK